MAQGEAAAGEAIAVAEIPESPAPAEKKRKKSKVEEDFGYDVDFETPFGKIEFALEPTAVKERKDQERREKAERDAAKAAAKAAKKAEKQMAKRGSDTEIITKSSSNLVPILLIFLLVAGAVAVAIWLFARPGEDEADVVPAEFLNDDAAAEPEPAGFVAKAQQRLGAAVRAGRQASREAQAEQERKFEDLTGKK